MNLCLWSHSIVRVIYSSHLVDSSLPIAGQSLVFHWGFCFLKALCNWFCQNPLGSSGSLEKIDHRSLCACWQLQRAPHRWQGRTSHFKAMSVSCAWSGTEWFHPLQFSLNTYLCDCRCLDSSSTSSQVLKNKN